LFVPTVPLAPPPLSPTHPLRPAPARLTTAPQHSGPAPLALVPQSVFLIGGLSRCLSQAFGAHPVVIVLPFFPGKGFPKPCIIRRVIAHRGQVGLESALILV